MYINKPSTELTNQLAKAVIVLWVMRLVRPLALISLQA